MILGGAGHDDTTRGIRAPTIVHKAKLAEEVRGCGGHHPRERGQRILHAWRPRAWISRTEGVLRQRVAIFMGDVSEAPAIGSRHEKSS